MTLDLIFLATMVGNVEHTVYIHTTQGNFPYQVYHNLFNKHFRNHTFTTSLMGGGGGGGESRNLLRDK